MAPTMGLTPQQRLFCHEYLVDRNGSRAAIRAGYSPKAAKEQATRLLTKAHVRTFVDKGLERLNKKVLRKAEVSLELVVEQLRKVLMADPLEGLNPDGTAKPLDEWPEDLRRALSGMEVKEELRFEQDLPVEITIRKVKFWSKTDAANQLMRYLGAYKDPLAEAVQGLADLIAGTQGPEGEGDA